MSYQKHNWLNENEQGAIPINKINLNEMETGIYNAYPVQLIAVSDTEPSECNIGDKYYNSITKEIYVAIDTNTWSETGETPKSDIAYWVLSQNGNFGWDGTDLVSIGGGKPQVVVSDTEPSGQPTLWIKNGEYEEIKYYNQEEEDYKTIQALDTLPIGAVIDYDGDDVPVGWEETEDKSKIIEIFTGNITSEQTATINKTWEEIGEFKNLIVEIHKSSTNARTCIICPFKMFSTGSHLYSGTRNTNVWFGGGYMENTSIQMHIIPRSGIGSNSIKFDNYSNNIVRIMVEY